MRRWIDVRRMGLLIIASALIILCLEIASAIGSYSPSQTPSFSYGYYNELYRTDFNYYYDLYISTGYGG
jgi:hypothetical protein